MNGESHNSRLDVYFLNALAVGAWFGLAAGIVEGGALLLFQNLGWLNWNIAQTAVNAEIVWISPVFDLALFAVFSLVAASVALILPSHKRARFLLLVLSFLTFLDWLLVSGRMRHVAALVLAVGLATAFTRWFVRHSSIAFRFGRRSMPYLMSLVGLGALGVRGGGWLHEYQATAALATAPSGSPNVVLLVMDTVRADHLSCYGYARETSSTVDRVAGRGVLFQNAFSTSSWTLPSHASLLTGLYPHTHGAVMDKYRGLQTVLPEILKSRGYRTAVFSGNIFEFTRTQGFGRGFLHFEDYFQSIGDMAIRTLYGRKFVDFVLPIFHYQQIPARPWSADINREALKWLQRPSQHPFFVMLNYLDAHDPYLPPEPFRTKFSKLPNPGGIIDDYRGRRETNMSTEEFQAEIDAYDGAIAYADHEFGSFLRALHERGLDRNTILIITADHGEEFMEHGLVQHKNALYFEELHVPLLISWPGRVPEGIRINKPISNLNIGATLVELLGMSDDYHFPGKSLVSLWKEPLIQSEWPHPLAELAQMPYPGMMNSPDYSGSMESLITPKWHYIVHGKFGPSLYDWSKDPTESVNLAAAPQFQVTMEELRLELRAMSLSPQEANVTEGVPTLAGEHTDRLQVSK